MQLTEDLLTVDSYLIPNAERYRTLFFSKARSLSTDKSPLDITVIITAGLIQLVGRDSADSTAPTSADAYVETKDVKKKCNTCISSYDNDCSVRTRIQSGNLNLRIYRPVRREHPRSYPTCVLSSLQHRFEPHSILASTP